LFVGGSVGACVGLFVGGKVKGCVGVGIIVVGTFVGLFVGGSVGACVGLFVGGSVGACVRFTRFFWCMLWGRMCLRLRYLAVN